MPGGVFSVRPLLGLPWPPLAFLGLLLASFWPHFGLLLGSIGLPLASPWPPLASLWPPFCLSFAFPWPFYGLRWAPLACPCFSLAFYGFSDDVPMLLVMFFLRLSYGFPVFFFNGFLMCFQWFPNGFTMLSQWFPDGFPIAFRCFPSEIPMVSQCFLNGFCCLLLLSCLVLSLLVLSSLVSSYLVLTCLALPCLLLSCLVLFWSWPTGSSQKEPVANDVFSCIVLSCLCFVLF